MPCVAFLCAEKPGYDGKDGRPLPHVLPCRLTYGQFDTFQQRPAVYVLWCKRQRFQQKPPGFLRPAGGELRLGVMMEQHRRWFPATRGQRQTVARIVEPA